jgi:CRP-like cAMP-binding protein
MALLKSTLEHEMLFSHLEESELATLLKAMYPKDYKGGEDIITQGAEDGDEFFVMANGRVDIVIGEKTVASQTSGCFGELALIYGASSSSLSSIPPHPLTARSSAGMPYVPRIIN